MLGKPGKLNAEELKTVQKKILRSNISAEIDLKRLSSAYNVSDPFTVCVLSFNGNKFVGVAKRMRYEPRKDKFHYQRGKDIALTRAVGDMLNWNEPSVE